MKELCVTLTLKLNKYLNLIERKLGVNELKKTTTKISMYFKQNKPYLTCENDIK